MAHIERSLRGFSGQTCMIPGQASRVLGLPRYSLAFLLDYCCKVKANKEYQLADWRVR